MGARNRAFEALHYMKRLGVRATGPTYSALIEACGRAGALQKAMMVLQEVTAMGETPDISSFNLVIRACADASKVDLAFQVADYMMSLQLPPNSHTFPEPSLNLPGGGLHDVAAAAAQLAHLRRAHRGLRPIERAEARAAGAGSCEIAVSTIVSRRVRPHL